MRKFLFLFSILLVAPGCSFLGWSDGDEAVENPVELGEDEFLPLPLTHPSRADARGTSDLIRGHDITPNHQTQIDECRRATQESLKGARGDQDLVNVIEMLKPLVNKEPSTFHWCFYKSMLELDLYLEASHTFKEKSAMFHKEMLFLWALSRALELDLADPQYFEFLQKRYIEMARMHFGRRVDVLAPPLDKRLEPVKLRPEDMPKRDPAKKEEEVKKPKAKKVKKKAAKDLNVDSFSLEDLVEDPLEDLDEEPSKAKK